MTKSKNDVCSRSCSPKSGIQLQHASKMMHHLQPFCHSGLEIITGMHVLDVYFVLQKTDTATSCVIPHLMLIKLTQTVTAHYFLVQPPYKKC